MRPFRFSLALACAAALAACQGASTRGGSRGEEAPAEQAQSKELHCGEASAYTNTSMKREFVRVHVDNRCEFTAYLWILFPNGRFIQKDIPGRSSLDLDTWIPNGGKIELECSLVSTVRDEGCTFRTQVLRRQ